MDDANAEDFHKQEVLKSEGKLARFIQGAMARPSGCLNRVLLILIILPSYL